MTKKFLAQEKMAVAQRVIPAVLETRSCISA